MDKNELEKYKKEMMNMYGRSTSKDSSTAHQIQENTNDVQPAIEAVDSEAEDDSAYHPFPENDRDLTDETEDEYNSKYPDPDLSEFNIEDIEADEENTSPPEYFSEESLGDSKGYILVNVRTGDESSAVEGASVMVTAIVEGKRVMLASGITDQSGTTKKFEVPAPDLSHSQGPGSATRPYNLFDVSVTAEGFFNARSVDVPVFSGITSVQNFSMIPVPLMMEAGSETVTTYNQEPSFGENGG